MTRLVLEVQRAKFSKHERQSERNARAFPNA